MRQLWALLEMEAVSSTGFHAKGPFGKLAQRIKPPNVLITANIIVVQNTGGGGWVGR